MDYTSLLRNPRCWSLLNLWCDAITINLIVYSRQEYKFSVSPLFALTENSLQLLYIMVHIEMRCRRLKKEREREKWWERARWTDGGRVSKASHSPFLWTSHEQSVDRKRRMVGECSASGDNWSVYAGRLLEIVKVDRYDGVSTLGCCVSRWIHIR